MFDTLRQRLILGLFILLILSIPIGAYLVSQNKSFKSSPTEPKSEKDKSGPDRTKPITSAKSTNSSAKELLNTSLLDLPKSPGSPQPSPSSQTTIANSFGPTLSLKARLEGREENNQTTNLFVGILEGSLTQNPKFLLSFTINLPQDGIYSGLSLAGLNPGATYTALLKGSAQIATSSAFVMSPTETKLNSDQVLNMLSGDLNDDNVINSSDYSLAQSAFGANPKSSNWRELADLNKDGIVNVIDLSIIAKNLGRIGASGAWTSTSPQTGTASASLNSPPVGSPDQTGGLPRLPAGKAGYWIWVPMSH